MFFSDYRTLDLSNAYGDKKKRKEKVPKLAEMKDLQDLLREVFAYTGKVHPFNEDEAARAILAFSTV
ncbi:MAG: hypothetical protein GWP08_05910 [Nitrospiraceae bacterium]|nr:hypothetical protein [Nitrospiraceae bacterium]